MCLIAGYMTLEVCLMAGYMKLDVCLIAGYMKLLPVNADIFNLQIEWMDWYLNECLTTERTYR